MDAGDRAQADALDRVWEALADRPAEPVRPGELDPHDAALPARLMEMERLAMHRSAPVPQWASVRDQVQRGTAPGPWAALRGLWPFATGGRPPSRSARGGRWWPALELAMGLAVIVVLLGIVYGWNPGQIGDGGSPTHPAFGAAPAGVGSIEETSTPTLPGAEPTVTASLNAAPTPTANPTTADSFDADGDGFMTSDELATAVAATIPRFTWPPDYQVSTELVMGPVYANSESRTGRFEMPFELSMLGTYHTCAWERTWLDARESGDEELAAEALAIMTQIIPYNPNYAPDLAAHMIEIARRAAAGDPSLVIQYVENNCDMEFLTPEAGTGSPVEISAPGISWNPNELTVAQGEIIRLINDGSGGPHNFIIEGYNDHAPVDKPPGSQTDWTVPSDLPPGTYTYVCTIPGHRALMEGTITILPADTGGGLSAPTPTATLP